MRPWSSSEGRRGCGGPAGLKIVVHDSREAAVRSAAEAAIKSISSIDDLKAKDPAIRIGAAERSAGLAGPPRPARPL